MSSSARLVIGCLGVVLSGCQGGSKAGAGLDLSASARAVDDQGSESTISATVTGGSGKPGAGSVSFKSSAGSLGTAQAVALDAAGKASAVFSCAVNADPDCHGPIRVTATWASKDESADGTVTIEVGPLPTGTGGGGGTMVLDAGARFPDCAALTAPEVVLQTTGRPEGIVSDGASIFWTNSALGTVSKMSLSGGAPVTLASGLTSPGYMGLDASFVYWASYPGKGLFRVAKSGGTAVPIYADTAFHLQVAAGAVTFTTSNGRTVRKIPVAGGAVTTIASEPDVPSDVAVGLDGTAYWVTDTSGNVMKSGATPKQLATGLGRATTVALAQNTVYWGTTSGTIGAVATGGGAATTLFSGLGFIGSMIATDENLYWTDYGRSKVQKGAFGGGTPVDLATSQSIPGGLVAVGSCIYWVNRTSAAIMRARQ